MLHAIRLCAVTWHYDVASSFIPCQRRKTMSRGIFLSMLKGFVHRCCFTLFQLEGVTLYNWQALRTDFRKCSQRVVGGKHLSMRRTMTHICALISFLYHHYASKQLKGGDQSVATECPFLNCVNKTGTF